MYMYNMGNMGKGLPNHFNAGGTDTKKKKKKKGKKLPRSSIDPRVITVQ